MGLLSRMQRRATTALAAEFQAEGVRYAAVTGGTLVLRDFRAPGLRSAWSKSTMRWSLVLTDRRLVLRAAYNKYREPIDTGWSTPGLARLKASVDEKGKLLLQFRAEDFRSDCSGEVTARLKLSDAATALTILDGSRG